MRFTGLSLACALVTLASASTEASVYIFPASLRPKSSDAPTTRLSLLDAKLLLAERLGLSQSFDLGTASDETLKLLNGVHGSQGLFAESASVRRLLILLEDPDSAKAVSTSQPPQYLVEVPSDADAESLVVDLLSQDRSRRGATSTCEYVGGVGGLVRGGFSSNEPVGYCSVSADNFDILSASPAVVLKDVYQKSLPSPSMDDSTAVFYIAPLAAPRPNAKDAAKSVDVLVQLKQIMSNLASTEDVESTIVLIPRFPTTPKHTTHHKRNDNKSGVKPRVSPKEAPMSIAQASKNPKPSPEGKHPAANVTGPPPKTTIATCWASEKACVANTQNCTSHGACFRKYTERVSSDEEGPECWTCGCRSSVVRLDGGATKTTYWGGPACQKKDVSVPFFLFAGFAVFALSLVSWGIGMLFSMGQEDLPSVLAAGVAPVHRK